MKKSDFTQTIINAAVQAILAGQHTHLIMLPGAKIPAKQGKCLCKRLKASDNWQLDGPTVYSRADIALTFIASWGGRLCVNLDGYRYRFRTLYLDYFGRRVIYLVPAAGNINSLPGIDLSKDELQALIQMANEISDSRSDREYCFTVKNPLRCSIIDRVDDWSYEMRKFYKQQEPKDKHGESEQQKPVDMRSELLELLKVQPELLDILTAAVDSQLRGIKRLRDAPVGIYNFLLPKKDIAMGDQLVAILRAATFSNEESAEPGPVIVQDLDSWQSCYRRLALILASRREVIQPILDDLQTRDRLRKCGKEPLPWRATLPIISGRSAICSPFAVDIEISGIEPLEFHHQDLLRTAVSELLSPKFAAFVHKSWAAQMARPSAYKLSGFSVWRKTLTENMLKKWFPESTRLEQASALCKESWQRQEADEQERKELLQCAFELITTPDRYADRIAERPESKEEAEDKLSDEFFAFRYSPTSGDNKGRHFLAFTKDSLRRLLDTVNFAPKLYGAFLDVCDKKGVLNSQDRSITLGGKTFHGITFELEK